MTLLFGFLAGAVKLTLKSSSVFALLGSRALPWTRGGGSASSSPSKTFTLLLSPLWLLSLPARARGSWAGLEQEEGVPEHLCSELHALTALARNSFNSVASSSVCFLRDVEVLVNILPNLWVMCMQKTSRRYNSFMQAFFLEG